MSSRADGVGLTGTLAECSTLPPDSQNATSTSAPSDSANQRRLEVIPSPLIVGHAANAGGGRSGGRARDAEAPLVAHAAGAAGCRTPSEQIRAIGPRPLRAACLFIRYEHELYYGFSSRVSIHFGEAPNHLAK